MAWKGVITNAGAALLDQWALGGQMAITSAATGTGTVAEAAMLAQTALKSRKQTASIISSEKLDSGIKLRMQITAPQTSYNLQQYGVWAKLGSGSPVMLALFQNTAGIVIPSAADSPDFVYTLYALLKIANEGDLEVTVDTSALVSQQTLEDAIEGVTAELTTHTSNSGIHITAAERTAWNGKYDKTGGVLTGNVTVQPSGAPNLTLSAPEKEGTGRSRTILQKNASGSVDYGTQLVDYVWGDGSTANQRTTLRLQCAAALAERLMLIDYAAGGSYVQYHLYGEHNPPGMGSVTGLAAALDGKAASSHSHAIANVTGLATALDGKVDKVTGKGLSTNDFTTAEKTKLAGIAAGAQVNSVTGVKGNAETSYRTGNINLTPANIGAAAASHTHGAGDITSGTLNAARLPTVPISKGGTGETTTLAAITALGGLSAASVGTEIPSGADIDALTTPGTYLSADSTVSASLQGTPPYTTGGFKLYVIRGYQNGVTIQLAQGASVTVYCRIKTSATGTWGSWQTYALGGHSHGSIRSDGSIGQDTDPEASDRLVITDASDGSLIKRGNIRLDGTTTDKALTPKGTWEPFLKTHQDISGKADVNHTHPYLPLTGGVLSGNEEIRQDSTTPTLTLSAPERQNTGRSKTTLVKNASSSVDYGTLLMDYVWGDGTNANQRVALRIQAAAADLKNRLMLVDYAAGGDYVQYHLYGEHNKPTIADVDGLRTALDGKAASSHSHSAGNITSGTLNAARLPAATASTQGAVKLGASGGAAEYSHTHDAGDITGTLAAARLPAATSTTQGAVKLGASGGAAAYSHTHSASAIASGTLDADRLPTVPITKGGTGETTALAALTALGGLSAADQGTVLATNSSLNTLGTPGTYYSPSADRSATITGAPVTEAGFRLFVLVGHNSNTVVQMANTNNHVYIRSTANQGSTWTDWEEFSKAGHHHYASDITVGTLAAARLPAATASTQGAVKLGASGGAAEYSHTHDAGDITGTLAAARLPTATSTTQGAVKLGASGGAAAYSHTHSYLPLSGGTLTGNLTLDPTGASAPQFVLLTADGTAGPGKMQLYKNANASVDYGTQLADYVWGDGGATTAKNVRIILRAATTALDSMLTLSVNQGTGGSSTAYRLYGEHYRPMVDPQDILTGTEDLNTLTDFGWYRCRTNTAAHSIKHTPGFDATTLVNTGLSAFNLTVGRIASDYAYQEVLVFNTGKRWYRYSSNPTAASPSWSAWSEH